MRESFKRSPPLTIHLCTHSHTNLLLYIVPDAQKVEPFIYDLPSDELYERGWGRIEAEADAQVYVYDVTRKETLEDIVNKWTTKLRGQCIEGVAHLC